jgi:hypothetical protein
MLSFERRVVDALLASVAEPKRTTVADHVDGVLRDMPEHVRAGIAGQSVLLGAWWAARSRLPASDLGGAALVESLEASPVGLVRQYIRLLRSLVLFAEHEIPDEVGA